MSNTDIHQKYRSGHVYDFDFWTMELSFRQHTLGSYILFCKRSVERISALNSEELFDFQKCLQKIEKVYSENEQLRPDRWNYLQMGNQLHSLHIHAIPRYRFPRQFLDRKWVDENYGYPVVWKMDEYPEEVILEMKKQIFGSLPEQMFL